MDTDTADQVHSPNPADIEVTVIVTPTEVIPGHIIETVDTTIGVLHDAIIPVLIVITMTHHMNGHPHIGIFQLTQKIAADPNHALHLSQVGKFCMVFIPS